MRRKRTEIKRLVKMVKTRVQGGEAVTKACDVVGIAYPTFRYHTNRATKRLKTERNRILAARRVNSPKVEAQAAETVNNLPGTTLNDLVAENARLKNFILEKIVGL